MNPQFLIPLVLAVALSWLPAENILFPDDPSVVNVKTVYGAKGDGVTDATAALTVIPEPGGIALLGLGLLALMAQARRKR